MNARTRATKDVGVLRKGFTLFPVELQMFGKAADRWMVFWWVVHLCIIGISVEGSPPCPEKCECTHEPFKVNCSSSQLSSVPKGIHKNTQSLNLANNLLQTLGKHQFSDLEQLQELDLSENMLTMIEVQAFSDLKNLLILRISQNRLKVIQVGVFSGLQSLCLLDISKNEILVFLNDMFYELPSLKKLYMNENELVFIPNRAFSGLLYLQELNLDGYNLSSTPTEALSQLPRLVRLHFTHTSLTVLPNNSFRQLTQLRELTLSHWHKLDTLLSNSLTGLNLTSLTLSYCNLSSVPYASLRHLVYLLYLDLSYNPINSIKAHLLRDLLRLQEFHLVGGNLKRVEPGAFHGLVNIQVFNVSLNYLSTLEETVFQSVETLQVLRLDGNPLACDCRLFWVLQHHLHSKTDEQPASCASPLQVQGRAFEEIMESELPMLFICRPAHILNRKLQEVHVEEGQTVLFLCQVDGDPSPSINWVSPQRALLPTTGRIRVLSNGTLEVRYVQLQDSGIYFCFASNVAGNDSIFVRLWVRRFTTSSSRNRSAHFFLDGWRFTSTHSPANGSSDSQTFPLDLKTLLVAVTMGFLSFLSSVAVCFIFMFFWSQSKGQIKHTAAIDFVPHSTGGGSEGGRTRMETGRFTMKLI
ncbi:leucine rich repeat and Ig domain containing 4a isoform X1 [Silurus asotus]|uniref:Leucine rich repeat and Ig domain containing 4a isoform X1 n=1 Tax=Silurus asotus TaxID=30991 RepID=A0AAD5A1J0_SILAS|nr:leucine rich repeat and Ig domain containing 4a isoform X1 [Silurus asotus]